MGRVLLSTIKWERHWFLSFFLWMVVGGLTGCSSDPKPVIYPTVASKKAYKEKLVAANRQLVTNDADSIKSFLKSKDWKMKEYGRGIWLEKIEANNGDRIQKDDIVTVGYKLEALDGYCYYTSDSTGNKEFRVGQGGVESGLEDALLLLSSGDSAHLILPPHLAHGLIGDGDRIPPRATIMYKLRVNVIGRKPSK